MVSGLLNARTKERVQAFSTKELPEARNDLLNSWGGCEHGVGQPGDDRNPRGKRDTRIDEGVKGANRFACLHLDCTDLADEVAL